MNFPTIVFQLILFVTICLHQSSGQKTNSIDVLEKLKLKVPNCELQNFVRSNDQWKILNEDLTKYCSSQSESIQFSQIVCRIIYLQLKKACSLSTKFRPPSIIYNVKSTSEDICNAKKAPLTTEWIWKKLSYGNNNQSNLTIDNFCQKLTNSEETIRLVRFFYKIAPRVRQAEFSLSNQNSQLTPTKQKSTDQLPENIKTPKETPVDVSQQINKEKQSEVPQNTTTQPIETTKSKGNQLVETTKDKTNLTSETTKSIDLGKAKGNETTEPIQQNLNETNGTIKGTTVQMNQMIKDKQNETSQMKQQENNTQNQLSTSTNKTVQPAIDKVKETNEILTTSTSRTNELLPNSTTIVKETTKQSTTQLNQNKQTNLDKKDDEDEDAEKNDDDNNGKNEKTQDNGQIGQIPKPDLSNKQEHKKDETSPSERTSVGEKKRIEGESSSSQTSTPPAIPLTEKVDKNQIGESEKKGEEKSHGDETYDNEETNNQMKEPQDEVDDDGRPQVDQNKDKQDNHNESHFSQQTDEENHLNNREDDADYEINPQADPNKQNEMNSKPKQEMKRPNDKRPEKTLKEEIHRRPKYPEDEGWAGNFITYFLVFTLFIVIAYLFLHNKNKLMGYLVEGRRSTSSRTGSRPSHRNYEQINNVNDLTEHFDSTDSFSNKDQIILKS